MQSEQHIRRLIRELDLPDQADQVIQRSKYWTPTFCRLYFEKCDELIFSDPRAGLQAAEVCPELVDLVGRFGREQESLARLRVGALAVLGSAYRAVGDLEQAQASYAEALRLTGQQQIPATEKANLHFRIAVLRCEQNRLQEALVLADRSVEIYRGASEQLRRWHLGEALTIRGFVRNLAGHSAMALKDWSEALSCTDPKRRPRVYYAATHNLAWGLAERATCSSDLAKIELYLQRARRMLSKQSRSLQKLRLIWLQGMIFMRFGSIRRGEAAFDSARRGFIEIGSPFDMALVSLDMARYLHQSRQFSELRALATETQQLFSSECADPRANRALATWKEAVMASSVSTQVFVTAWQTLQQRALEISQGGILLER